MVPRQLSVGQPAGSMGPQKNHGPHNHANQSMAFDEYDYRWELGQAGFHPSTTDHTGSTHVSYSRRGFLPRRDPVDEFDTRAESHPES